MIDLDLCLLFIVEQTGAEKNDLPLPVEEQSETGFKWKAVYMPLK